MTEQTTTDGPAPYVERLAVPRRWYPYGAFLAVVVGALFAASAGGVPATVAVYAVFVILMWVALRLIGPTIRLADGVLTMSGKKLDAARVTRVEPLDAVALRQALGPAAARGATVLTRWWVKVGLRVVTSDGTWLISTRHPLMLADALRRSAGHPVVVGRALRAQDRASFLARLTDLRDRLAVHPPVGEPDSGWSTELQVELQETCERLRGALVRGERLAGTDIPDVPSRLAGVAVDSAVADDLCWTLAQLAATIGVAPSYRSGLLLPR